MYIEYEFTTTPLKKSQSSGLRKVKSALAFALLITIRFEYKTNLAGRDWTPARCTFSRDFLLKRYARLSYGRPSSMCGR